MKEPCGALFSGQRVPITGRTRGSAPDIKSDHPIFSRLSFEVKHRKLLASWMHDAFKQATASIRGEQFPVVLLHQKGKKYEESYVMMQVKDFIELTTKLKSEETDKEINNNG